MEKNDRFCFNIVAKEIKKTDGFRFIGAGILLGGNHESGTSHRFNLYHGFCFC